MARRKKKTAAPLTLSSLRQVKALAHPLRYRVFERLVDEPCTGRQLAETLGTSPTQLYHHLGVLERSGLIRQVATRRKRGTTEKYYQAVSDRVALDRKLFGGRVEAGGALVGQVLRTTLDELLAAQSLTEKAPTGAPPMLKRLKIRATPRKIESLVRALDRWLASCEQASQEDADDEYAVVVAFYPRQVGPPRSKS